MKLNLWKESVVSRTLEAKSLEKGPQWPHANPWGGHDYAMLILSEIWRRRFYEHAKTAHWNHRPPCSCQGRAPCCGQGQEKKWTKRTVSVPPDPLPLHSVTLPLAEWNKGLEQERNGFKAVCRTPALHSSSSACVSEGVRAGWDGLTVRTVYVTLFLHVYALTVTPCKYLVIKVYLRLILFLWILK